MAQLYDLSNPFLGIGSGGGITLPQPPKLPGFEIGVVIPPATNAGVIAPGASKDNQATAGGAAASASGWVLCLLNPTNPACLIRFLFLILGLICIIGAIYLYRPVNEILGSPIETATRQGIRAGVAGLVP